MNKYIEFIFNPRFRHSILNSRGVYKNVPDRKMIEKEFRLVFGKKLDLNNPQTFNEKLQWLKLYNRKPIYTTMVDKYEAKKYVADIIGEEYIIPTLGVWDRFEDIDFDALPDQFVLKCTHDSGGLVICKDKSKLDIGKAEKKIKKSLVRDYYLYSREWPYKDVQPRIIAEQFMKDRDFEVLNVFKIFNFNGEPKIIQAIQGDKTKDESIDYFDIAWNKLALRQNFKNSEKKLLKPETLDEMLELAKKLSKGHPFLRTDFYEVNGKVYFSEFTFFSDSGMAKFEPEEWDYTFGSWIKLPEKQDAERK